jgi:hypothetical protein
MISGLAYAGTSGTLLTLAANVRTVTLCGKIPNVCIVTNGLSMTPGMNGTPLTLEKDAKVPKGVSRWRWGKVRAHAHDESQVALHFEATVDER